MGGYITLILPRGFAPGHKLQKLSKESGVIQSLGTISYVFFTKRQSQKRGGGGGVRERRHGTMPSPEYAPAMCQFIALCPFLMREGGEKLTSTS